MSIKVKKWGCFKKRTNPYLEVDRLVDDDREDGGDPVVLKCEEELGPPVATRVGPRRLVMVAAVQAPVRYRVLVQEGSKSIYI